MSKGDQQARCQNHQNRQRSTHDKSPSSPRGLAISKMQFRHFACSVQTDPRIASRSGVKRVPDSLSQKSKDRPINTGSDFRVAVVARRIRLRHRPQQRRPQVPVPSGQGNSFAKVASYDQGYLARQKRKPWAFTNRGHPAIGRTGRVRVAAID